MPVILHRSPPEIVQEADIMSLLEDANGELTLAGRVLLAFLESVNYDDLLSDPDLVEFVEHKTVKGTLDEDGEEVVADEKGEDFTVESMAGADVAEFIDEADLFGMFEFYVQHLPESTVEEKVLKAAGQRLLGQIEEREDDIVEAAKEGDEGAVKLDEAKFNFKKGDFVKIRKGKLKTGNGKTGKDVVTQMMLAMFHKGAIKRSPSKGAYKAPGAVVHTWKKDAGYGEGTASGKAKVAKYKSAKKGQQAKTKKKVKGAAGAEMKAKAKEKAAKLKAKASKLEKKKPGTVSGAKKSLVAHDTDVRNDRIDEGLSLANKLVAGSAKPKDKTLNG
jgi:hypothetical protein